MEKMPNQTEALVDMTRESTYREVLLKFDEFTRNCDSKELVLRFTDWLIDKADIK